MVQGLSLLTKKGGRVVNSGGGRGGDTALWLDPHPRKGLNWRALRNPTTTDPRVPEVTRTHNSAKNANGIFGISASRGFRKSSFAMYLVGEKIDHFQCSKK